MGSFIGHLVPGLVLLILGLRWTYCIFWRYFLCLREQASTKGRSRRFRSSLMYPISCCPSFPLDAAFLLASVVSFSIGTFIATYHLEHNESADHIAMYTIFGIAAMVVLLKHYKWPVIPDSDYACFILSFLVNVYLMNRHIDGKSYLEIKVHENGMLAMIFGAVALALEMKYRYNPLLSLIRAFCFSLSGSWTVMAGFILHSPWGAWAPEDHMSHMMATISFVGHIASHLQLAGLIGAVAFVRVRKLDPAEVSLALDREWLDKREEMTHKIASKSDQSEYLLGNSDDEV